MRPHAVAQPAARARPPRLLRRLQGVLRRSRRRLAGALFAIGDFVATLGRGLLPGHWRRTMRDEFMRYLDEVGYRAIPAVVVAALLVAVGLVLQIIYWLGIAGQQGRIGEFLVVTLVQQTAPVVTALIVIGRSGAVLVDEIGQLAVSGHLRLLASYGIDPTDLLIIPRASATALATLLLTLLFLHTALWSGFAGATLVGATQLSAREFIAAVFRDMGPGDHLALLVKPLLTGYLVAYLSMRLGMRARGRSHGSRKALPQAFVASLLATFAISVLISAGL